MASNKFVIILLLSFSCTLAVSQESFNPDQKFSKNTVAISLFGNGSIISVGYEYSHRVAKNPLITGLISIGNQVDLQIKFRGNQSSASSQY